MARKEIVSLYSVSAWMPDGPDDTDFTYSLPGQPHWMKAWSSGPELLRAIADTMDYARTWLLPNELAMASDDTLVMVCRVERQADGSMVVGEDETVIAMWRWNGKQWKGHSWEGPHPVSAPGF